MMQWTAFGYEDAGRLHATSGQDTKRGTLYWRLPVETTRQRGRLNGWPHSAESEVPTDGHHDDFRREPVASERGAVHRWLLILVIAHLDSLARTEPIPQCNSAPHPTRPQTPLHRNTRHRPPKTRPDEYSARSGTCASGTSERKESNPASVTTLADSAFHSQPYRSGRESLDSRASAVNRCLDHQTADR